MYDIKSNWHHYARLYVIDITCRWKGLTDQFLSLQVPPVTVLELSLGLKASFFFFCCVSCCLLQSLPKEQQTSQKWNFLIFLFLQSGLKQYVKSHISHPCSVRLKRLFGGVTFTYTKISHSSQGYNQGLEKLHFVKQPKRQNKNKTKTTKKAWNFENCKGLHSSCFCRSNYIYENLKYVLWVYNKDIKQDKAWT